MLQGYFKKYLTALLYHGWWIPAAIVFFSFFIFSGVEGVGSRCICMHMNVSFLLDTHFTLWCHFKEKAQSILSEDFVKLKFSRFFNKKKFSFAAPKNIFSSSRFLKNNVGKMPWVDLLNLLKHLRKYLDDIFQLTKKATDVLIL